MYFFYLFLKNSTFHKKIIKIKILFIFYKKIKEMIYFYLQLPVK